ncbi:MAG: hypothetical protein WBL54_10495, partial [Nitrososphaeraceae archaeon]
THTGCYTWNLVCGTDKKGRDNNIRKSMEKPELKEFLRVTRSTYAILRIPGSMSFRYCSIGIICSHDLCIETNGNIFLIFHAFTGIRHISLK